jgi:uncharacterized damage-inducible protein DinB
MALIDGLFQELDMEMQTTRRVLERVPDDRLGWRPHAKSRSLGGLALHVAMTPGSVAQLVSSPSPAQVPDFAAMEQSVAQAKKALGGLDDAALLATWRLARGEQELLALPRIAFLRSIMLNHWYHHRGQLTVYLRELNVPVPSIYGPSADENPFAG